MELYNSVPRKEDSENRAVFIGSLSYTSVGGLTFFIVQLPAEHYTAGGIVSRDKMILACLDYGNGRRNRIRPGGQCQHLTYVEGVINLQWHCVLLLSTKTSFMLTQPDGFSYIPNII